MTRQLPHAQLVALGGAIENERDGYVKYTFGGGFNFIASSFRLPTRIPSRANKLRPSRPLLDHVGVDLRARDWHRACALRRDPRRRAAGRLGARASGRTRRAVHCCHTHVAEKHWVYPLSEEDSVFERPLEFATVRCRSAPR